MQHEKNIESLKQQLSLLGFAGGLESELYAKICFRPAKFDIAYRLIKEQDIINFTLYLEGDDESRYTCLYYDACLRKNIPVPDGFAGEVDVVALNNTMDTIDWGLFAVADKHALIEMANRVDEVLSGLQQLATTTDGKKIADLLKFKHWCDTPIEYLVNGLATFKNQYETTQRFYLSEGHGITTEEAYRFLCNRWVERKLLAKKKEQDNIIKNELEPQPAAIVKKRKQKRA